MKNKGSQLLQSIFNTDNAFMKVCEKVLDLASVNLLFVLTCLPLVTVGTAKVSLYQTLFDLKGQRRVGVFAAYSRHFRDNWKLGFRLGLLELAVSGISALDLALVWQQEALPFQLLKVICLALLFFTSLLSLCVYPLAGHFELDLKALLQTGLMLVSLQFPWFFLMVAVLAVIAVVLSSSDLLLLLGLSLFVLIGFAGLAFLQVHLMEHIFDKYKREHA